VLVRRTQQKISPTEKMETDRKGQIKEFELFGENPK
jgi:hypothetical protein